MKEKSFNLAIGEKIKINLFLPCQMRTEGGEKDVDWIERCYEEENRNRRARLARSVAETGVGRRAGGGLWWFLGRKVEASVFDFGIVERVRE